MICVNKKRKFLGLSPWVIEGVTYYPVVINGDRIWVRRIYL